MYVDIKVMFLKWSMSKKVTLIHFLFIQATRLLKAEAKIAAKLKQLAGNYVGWKFEKLDNWGSNNNNLVVLQAHGKTEGSVQLD